MRLPILCLCLGLAACGQPDKTLHFTAGAVTSRVVTQATGDPIAGCLAAMGVGMLKEAYDATGRGTVETGDFLATSAGCTLTYRF